MGKVAELLFMDPSMVFGWSTLALVLFVDADERTSALMFHPPRMDEAFEFFTAPAMLCLYFYVALAVGSTMNCDWSRVSATDMRRAGWCLSNGAIFQLTMDGLSGEHKLLPLLSKNYELLDRRFRAVPQDQGGAHSGERILVFIVANIELFLDVPLCFLAFYSVVHQKSWRHEVQLVLYTLQWAGLIFYIGPEFLSECQNLPPIGVPGCNPPFTLYNLFYFYFAAIVLNVVWFFVPTYMGYNLIKESAALKDKAAKVKSQ